MLPTVITEDFSVMLAAGNAIAQSIAAKTPGIIGVHFEGPHLSLPKKGIHPEQHIRPISEQEIALFCRKDMGQVLVTVAPENVSADVIKVLVSNNVHVCLGHSNADGETVAKALEAGATGFTHLFNAMSPLTSREPGMVGTALADTDSYCGLIVDFHHVHETACKLAIRTKSPGKIMLVTDAMSHVGSDQISLSYCDTQIVREGDKLTVPDGTLAGSALDMATAVQNCHHQLNIPLVDTLKMATSTPASFLGLGQQVGHLVPGAQANLQQLNGDLEVQSSWINGCKEYSRK
jgi:N-acetylglucosamine-6-phosphate deacetylase